MKKFNILLILFVLFSAISCIPYEERESEVTAEFEGNWSGSFSGDENGTIHFTVEKGGTIVGEITLDSNNFKEEIGGAVNTKGKFDMNTNSNIFFSGYFYNSQTTGNWIRNNITGDFHFQKQ